VCEENRLLATWPYLLTFAPLQPTCLTDWAIMLTSDRNRGSDAGTWIVTFVSDGLEVSIHSKVVNPMSEAGYQLGLHLRLHHTTNRRVFGGVVKDTNKFRRYSVDIIIALKLPFPITRKRHSRCMFQRFEDRPYISVWYGKVV
jgi:hypothetical protein